MDPEPSHSSKPQTLNPKPSVYPEESMYSVKGYWKEVIKHTHKKVGLTVLR